MTALQRNYDIKLAQARQAALRVSETAAVRERALTARLHDAQQVALQMSRAGDGRMRRLQEALESSQLEALRLSQTIVARERDFAAQLEELRRMLAEREQELGSQVARAREDLNALALGAAEASREALARLDRANAANEEKSHALAKAERELELLHGHAAEAKRFIDHMARVPRDTPGSLPDGDDASEDRSAAPVGVAQLLTLRGRNFVEQAYRILLHRDPDRDGLRHYLGELRAGIDRVEIVRRIRYSPEGRMIAADVRGIRARLFLAFLYRIPVVGHLLESVGDVAGLLAFARRRRAFEHSVAEELERVRAESEEKTTRLLKARELLIHMETGRPEDHG